MPSININSVTPNSKVYITGIVEYSHVATQIDGDELALDNMKRTANGLQTIDKPYTRLTINKCVINYADPAAPTVAEQYIAERLYASKKHPENSPCYSAINKSKNLPNLFCRDNAQSKQLEAVMPEGELAPGVPVTIMIRFFASKKNNGCSLDSIIVNEKPIRYFGSNTSEAMLADAGFEIVNKGDVNAVKAQLDANLAQPAPAPAPVTPAPVAPAPYAQAAPVPTPSAVPAPNPASANPAPSLPIPPSGYTYDENGRIVPISSLDTQPSGGIKL